METIREALIFKLIIVISLLIAQSTSLPIMNATLAFTPSNKPPNSFISVVAHRVTGSRRFCHIGLACRKGDGSFLLPVWMKPHSSLLEMCGLSQVTFGLRAVKESMNRSYLSLHGVHGIELDEQFLKYDLFGTEAPHGERHLLVQDMTPLILMMDIIRNPAMYKTQTSTNCIGETKSDCGNNSKGIEPRLHPLLMVDSRISETKEFMWPKSILRLVRNSFKGNLVIKDLREIYHWKVKSRAACFRSILSTRIETGDIAQDAFKGSNMFFNVNRLSRKPIGQSSLSFPCTAKVLILNRYGKRFIEGTDKLTLAIRFYAKLLSSKTRKAVEIQPEVVFFEKSSFHEQVSVMQESNVVVASHGDSNANIMFLRPGSRVFEILPFGYSSNLFANLSRAYGVLYESVKSQPDETVFWACVRHFNHENSLEQDVILREWRREAHAFQKRTWINRKNVKSNYSLPENDSSSLKNLRQCASYQRISVDVRHLARKVVLASAEQCRIQNLSFLRT